MPLSLSRREISSPSGFRQPAGQILVAGIADADDEIVADPVADRPERVKGKAQPVVEAAAIGAVQLIGQGRPELVHQMAVSLQLDPVEAGRLHPLGRVGDNPR
jgi:hypothetical protein